MSLSLSWSLSLSLSLSLYATNLCTFHHVFSCLDLTCLDLTCLELICLELSWLEKYYYCYYRHDAVWARLTLSYHIISYFMLSLLPICSPFYFSLFRIDLIEFDLLYCRSEERRVGKECLNQCCCRCHYMQRIYV